MPKYEGPNPKSSPTLFAKKNRFLGPQSMSKYTHAHNRKQIDEENVQYLWIIFKWHTNKGD